MATQPGVDSALNAIDGADHPQPGLEMNALPSMATEATLVPPIDHADKEHTTAQPSHPTVEAAASSMPAEPSSSQQPAEPSSSQQPAEPSSSQQPTEPEPANPSLNRQQTEALGPAIEAPLAPPSTAGPALSITLQLTTGARHPYTITEKYLAKRKTEARNSTDGSFDPRELTGYKLKELIWADWRNEWEPRPASPSSIRLIILGKMVDDKKALKDYAFNVDGTNIVHMTLKPADYTEDEEVKGAGKGGLARARDGEDAGAGCRCVIL